MNSSPIYPAARPASCTLEITPWLLVILLLALYAPMGKVGLTPTWQAFFMGGAVTLLACAVNFFTASWRGRPRPPVELSVVLRRTGVKWLGTQLGFVVTLFGWWLLSDFHSNYYKPFFEVLDRLLVFFPVVTAVSLFYTEWRLGPAMEKHWHMGLLVMGRANEVDWRFIRDDLFSWLVKGIFLPVNFCEFVYMIMRLHASDPTFFTAETAQVHYNLMNMLYWLILGTILPGYLFSSRLFDTQIKSVDSSWFGWMVTMCCYSPFVYGIFTGWFDYTPERANPIWMKPWAVLGQENALILYSFGAIILLSECVHLWGESILGIRASNLTNRGIVTNGPFRFTKHPVYVAKCIGWFFLWLPFLMGKNFFEDVRLTLCWLGVCGVYYLRSWVEERLLSRDPVYVAYGLYMDQHGAFAFMGRLIPIFSFKWRLDYWRKNGWAN